MDFLTQQQYFDLLYSDINAFEISMDSRKKRDMNHQSLTYGEIEFSSFKEILDLVSPKPGEIFYDLGCGVGKPVFASALLYSFEKTVGVEILPELYNKAMELKERFNKEILPNLPYKISVEFICNDILEQNFSEADIVYIASTCFDTDFMEKLAAQAVHLKEGARIVTLTKQLYAPYLHLKARKSFKMSWGDNTVIIVEKRALSQQEHKDVTL